MFLGNLLGYPYRADWEPAAPSGKCVAGVPRVFWRCRAVLQGPSTHNPTLVAGKTLILKNWPIFPLCMWKMGGSAPFGQARLSRPNWPQCAKSHAAWQSLSSRAEKSRIFSKIVVYFLTDFFKVLVICQRWFKGNPYFEKLADLWQIWPYSRYRGQIQ